MLLVYSERHRSTVDHLLHKDWSKERFRAELFIQWSRTNADVDWHDQRGLNWNPSMVLYDQDEGGSPKVEGCPHQGAVWVKYAGEHWEGLGERWPWMVRSSGCWRQRLKCWYGRYWKSWVIWMGWYFHRGLICQGWIWWRGWIRWYWKFREHLSPHLWSNFCCLGSSCQDLQRGWPIKLRSVRHIIRI